MIKNTIRLTEKKSHQIMRENVKDIVNEDYDFINDIDITKIPIEILRKGYFDYRDKITDSKETQNEQP